MFIDYIDRTTCTPDRMGWGIDLHRVNYSAYIYVFLET